MKTLMAAALAETGLVLYRDITSEHTLPPPGDFAAVVLFFGGLSLFPESASTFAALVGWGMVVATFLGVWSPRTPTSVGPAKPATTPGSGSGVTLA
jgi:hypothetical protein